MLAHLFVLRGQKDQPSVSQTQQKHGDERREEPPHPAGIELPEAEVPLSHPLVEDPGNQVAGDDKKDIHPDESSRQEARKGMVKHHRQNSHSP